MKIVRPMKVFSTKQKRTTTTATMSKPTQLQINTAKKTATTECNDFIVDVNEFIE